MLSGTSKQYCNLEDNKLTVEIRFSKDVSSVLSRLMNQNGKINIILNSADL